MNVASPVQPVRRRRLGRWLLLGVAVLLTPLLLAGAVALSVLTLNRDAAALRREVMAASGSRWHTKVQLSAGWLTLGAVRGALHFVHHKDIADARLALAAVRSASVGVYERSPGADMPSVADLVAHADAAMRARGLVRLLGVLDGHETVLAYVSDEARGSGAVDVCLAVIDGQQLVVVSSEVAPDAIGALVARHAPEGLRGKLQVARLGR